MQLFSTFLFLSAHCYDKIIILTLVSKPAPFWEGTAVVNGEFKSLNITDFLGKWDLEAQNIFEHTFLSQAFYLIYHTELNTLLCRNI